MEQKENQKAGAVGQNRGKRTQRDQIWHTRKQEPAMFSDAWDCCSSCCATWPSHNLSAESLVLRHFSVGGGKVRHCGLSRTLSHINGDRADGRPGSHVVYLELACKNTETHVSSQLARKSTCLALLALGSCGPYMPVKTKLIRWKISGCVGKAKPGTVFA